MQDTEQLQSSYGAAGTPRPSTSAQRAELIALTGALILSKGERTLPGAGERHSTHDKGHEEGGSAYAKAGSSLGSAPDILEHLPPQKNQSLPTLLLCALTSDFTGGCPPPPSHSLCQRVNLQLQLIKFLGN